MNYQGGYGQGMPGISFPTVGPAIKWLMIALVVCFFLDLPFNGRLTLWLAARWDGMIDWFGLGSLRVFTYMWLHQFGNPMHLIKNLLVLYFIGTMAEMKLGYRGTLKLFVVAGLAGGVFFVLMAPLVMDPSTRVVGASGGAVGLLVYAATWQPRMTIRLMFVLPIQLWVLAAFVVGLDFYWAWFEAMNLASGGVAHTAHLGGAALGFAAAKRNWFIDYNPYSHEKGLLVGAKEKVNEWKEVREAKKEQADTQVMDRLLEKIQNEGMSALTPSERKFMEKASKRMRDR